MKSSEREIVLGIFVLIILIVTSYFFLNWIFDVFLKLEKTVQASIIAAIVGLFSILFTFWKERRRSFIEAHREKKIQAYSKFVDVLFDFLSKTKHQKTNSELKVDDNFQQLWMDMSKELLFYGSPKVLTAFNSFKNPSNQTENTSMIIRRVGQILLAIREDIGLSNRGLNEINIHQIYLSDNVEALLEEK